MSRTRMAAGIICIPRLTRHWALLVRGKSYVGAFPAIAAPKKAAPVILRPLYGGNVKTHDYFQPDLDW